jgi:poly [ADP-ribose] polymerase 1
MEVKKVKSEKDDKESLLREQNEGLWKLRDQLDKELTNEAIKELLEDNLQYPLKGRDDSLTQLCDAMYFGPLKKCPECVHGQLMLRSRAYYCTGNITEWTKCTYKTQDPLRLNEFEINRDFRDEYTCMKKFKFKKRQRLFASPLESEDASKLEGEKQTTDNTKKIESKRPLYRLDFSATGKLSIKNAQVKAIIERLGGKLLTNVSNRTVALISNREEFENLPKKVQDAKSNDVHVIDEAFLNEINTCDTSKVDLLEMITRHSLATWGSDLKTRIELSRETYEKAIEEANESRFSLKSVGDGSGKIKMKVKGGAAVDPDTGLEDIAHVMLEPKTNEPYSCVLGMVDIVRGTNSFYKLQIIQHDKISK